MKHEWLSDIKAIGWDLDGTLYPPDAIPSEEIQERQYQSVMRTNEWDREQSVEEYKDTYARLGSHTKTLTALGVDGSDFFVNLWDELPLEKYIHKDLRMMAIFSRLTSYRHFLVSNSNSKAQVERKLGLVGINPSVFGAIVSTQELGAVKPDPKPFMAALDALRISPGSALYVGDRVSTDVRGASGVGMKTCLVWGQSDEADISLPTPYDLVTLFEQI